jgi:hypothetical protein
MQLPIFERIRPEDPALSRLEENVARVLDAARLRILQRGLSYAEHFRGEVLARAVTVPLASPVVLELSADFSGPADFLQVLDATATDGRHFAGVQVEWEPATVGNLRTLRLHSVSGLADGTYTLRLFISK